MRTITPAAFNVYTYAELSDEAKAKARQAWFNGYDMSDEIRYVIAASLTSNGWEGIDPAEGEADTADLDRLQFSVSHSQGDFVAFALEKNWEYAGTTYRVKVTMHHRGGGSMGMTVDLVDENGDSAYDGSDAMDHAETAAEGMVRAQAAQALSEGSRADLDATDPGGFIEDLIENNDGEFLIDGTPFYG